MPTTAEAWAALVRAMENTLPRCDGDDRFTQEDIGPSTARILREVCQTCPLLELCADYADRARPSAGFWAGRPRKGRAQ